MCLAVIVLAASIFGAGFPVAAMKLPWLKIPSKAFFMCKHFGTGVLVATAFVHVRLRSLVYSSLLR
jgi:solute carrier family 39 (zinc transporter), member 1/2/3